MPDALNVRAPAPVRWEVVLGVVEEKRTRFSFFVGTFLPETVRRRPIQGFRSLFRSRSGLPLQELIRRCSQISRDWRVNHEIRVREVRVVGADGEQLGVFPIHEALRMAEQAQLDLVEVAPQARPPVCRLMDYGRYKYEQSKRDRESRKKQKTVTVKELRMSPKTDRHDIEVKVRNAERFLREGDRVKFTVRFRGREIVHTNLVRDRLMEMAQTLSEVGVVERPPFMEGRQMVMLLAPKRNPGKDGGGDARGPAPRSTTEGVVVSAES